MQGPGRSDRWFLSGQLVLGWLPFPTQLARGQPLPADVPVSRLDVGLATLVASLSRGVGPGVELQLPVGLVSQATSLSAGLADSELRGRWSFAVGERVVLRATAGVVLPTGPYGARSGAQAFLSGAAYITLGRGTTWALAELDGRVELPGRFSLSALVSGRAALADAFDGFRWGPEVRALLSPSWQAVEGRLSLGLPVDVWWRAQSQEVNVITESGRPELVPSVNTGGVWLTLSPTAQLTLVPGVSVFASLRLPLWQQPGGLQYINGPGVFLGVSGSLEVFSPVRAAAPTPGRVTLVDYWASWCEPCKLLEPVLEALAARHGAVLQRVDVTSWSDDELRTAEPTAAGLPFVVVYDAQGRRMESLNGPTRERLVEVLERLR